MAEISGEVTIVLTTTGAFGSLFCSVRVSSKYSVNIAPTSLPVISLYSPSSSTAMPSLSQSGSVATRRSAFFVFERFIAHSKACLISGLGYGQVGKFPSGNSCSGTTVTSSTPIILRILRTGLFPVPLSGV